MRSRILSGEKILLLVIWAGYLVASVFSYEPIKLDWEHLFYSLYYIGQAYLIAFTLGDKFLPKRRYVAFAFAAGAVIAIAAILNEYGIETYLFKDQAAVWYGVTDSATDAVTVSLFVLVVRFVWRHHENQRRLEKMAREKAEAELLYLKAQINPHVLFNALNNIYSFALQKSDLTPGLILKLSDILRYMIYDCSDDAVLVEKEASYLADFVDIQKLALENRGAAEFSVTGAASDKRIPPFLLIPFVENAFKHSLNTLDKNIRIKIDIEIEDRRLKLMCRNNYAETPAETVQESPPQNGLGLKNVARRLKLLFNEDYLLRIDQSGGVFNVALDVPVQ